MLAVVPSHKVFAYDTQPIDTVPYISEYQSTMLLSLGGTPYRSNIQSDYKASFNVSSSSPSYIGYGFSLQTSDGSSPFHYPFNFSEYDYWVAFSFWSESGSTGKVSFVPTSLRLSYTQEGVEKGIYCTDFSFLHNDSVTAQGFTALGKIPSNFSSSTVRAIQVLGSGSVSSGTVFCRAFIYQVAKGENYTLADVVNAINNQTSILDNSIQNGNVQTEDIINGSDSELESTKNDFNDMNDKLNQYDDIESGFINDFDSAMNGIEDSVNGFRFDGILPAANWLSEQMSNRYNVMGDFKFFVIFPVIFAIALIMIGGSIGKKF